MFRRKLRSLHYVQAENFDAKNEAEVRNLVLWLEDQKIRFYKIEEREGLRAIEDPNQWTPAFSKYLKDMDCPYSESDIKAVIDWLLGTAVRYEYADNVDKYKDKSGDKLKTLSADSATHQLKSENPLDSLDFDHKDFKEGVHTLAKLLNVPPHPDHLVTLKAIGKLVEGRLTAKELPEELSKKGQKENQMSIEQFELGFDTGDPVLNNAARILRLLHVQELRNLQTKINETIVAVQNLTADPRTNDKLGKVGYG